MTTRYVIDWCFEENKDAVRRWMAQNAGSYYDCGEVNTTLLGEDAAGEFDLYEDEEEYIIPECVFELAAEVADWSVSSHIKEGVDK